MIDQTVHDILRIVALIQAIIVCGTTLEIVRRYIPVLRNAQNRKERLLAYHILLIGLSYVAANISVSIDLMVRYGMGWSWRLPTALFIFTSGDLALCLMIWRLVLVRKLYKLGS